MQLQGKQREQRKRLEDEILIKVFGGKTIVTYSGQKVEIPKTQWKRIMGKLRMEELDGERYHYLREMQEWWKNCEKSCEK